MTCGYVCVLLIVCILQVYICHVIYILVCPQLFISRMVFNYYNGSGIRKVLIEVAKTSTDVRKFGVSELLWYAMRGTSSRLHSRAQEVLQLLMDKSVYYIRGQLIEGNGF